MRVIVCLIFAWTMLAGPAAHAANRVALVIGNSSYQHVPALPNPANDAADIAASLERLGFTVQRLHNGSFDDMRRALRDFAPLASRSEVALVFFAGHGIEIGAENWLIPVDAQLKMDVLVEQEAVALRSILPIVGAASQLGLVILDACRNNPFAPAMQRSIPTRAVSRGLARVEPTGTVLVAYAARDGTTADDGSGRNSPYTRALLKHLETAGQEINYLFRNVRDEVVSSTNPRQEPIVYGALPRTEIYLKPKTDQPKPGQTPVVAATPPPVQPAPSPPPASPARTSPAPVSPAPAPSAAAPPPARETLQAAVPPASKGQDSVQDRVRSPSGNYAISRTVSGGIHNMRAGPGTGHPLVVAIPAGSRGVALGECRNPDDGRSRYQWCRATWNGHSGWLSMSGIAR